MCVHARTQSCPALCDPLDCSLLGSSVHGIARQEYWSGWPFPPPGDLPDPGIEPGSLASPALAGGFFTTMPPGKPKSYSTSVKWGERRHLPCRWAVLEKKHKLGIGHSNCYYDGVSGVQLGP